MTYSKELKVERGIVELVIDKLQKGEEEVTEDEIRGLFPKTKERIIKGGTTLVGEKVGAGIIIIEKKAYGERPTVYRINRDWNEEELRDYRNNPSLMAHEFE